MLRAEPGTAEPRTERRTETKPQKKKGPLVMTSGPSLGRKRPRRAAIASGYRTATICGRAAQSARVFEAFSMQKSQAWQNRNSSQASEFTYVFSETCQEHWPLMSYGERYSRNVSRFRDRVRNLQRGLSRLNRYSKCQAKTLNFDRARGRIELGRNKECRFSHSVFKGSP